MGESRKICVGVFLGAHGVRGHVRLCSYTASPETFFDYAPLTDESGARVFDVTLRGEGTDHFLVAVKGITDRNAAEALKGTKLFVDRSVLPPEDDGEYYQADLIGLLAQDAAGQTIGLVEGVHDYGAGVFLEIKPKDGKSFMLPFKDEFVPVVDVKGGTLTALIPEGWLGEDKAAKEKR